MKHFIKEGNIYKMRFQKTFAIVLIVGLLIISFVGYYTENKGIMWVFLALGVLSAISISIKKMEIDLDNREIRGRVALAKGGFVIPIDRIQNFELYSLSQNFIRTNTALNVYYLNDNGKEKIVQLAQGFTLKAMQNILNEIEDIIGNEPIEG